MMRLVCLLGHVQPVDADSARCTHGEKPYIGGGLIACGFTLLYGPKQSVEAYAAAVLLAPHRRREPEDFGLRLVWRPARV